MADAAEEIIRENCKELDIEVIDMAVNVDHKTLHKTWYISFYNKLFEGKHQK